MLLQECYSWFQVTVMIKWGQKSKPKKSVGHPTKPKKFVGPKINLQKSYAKFPSLKNFQKALTVITQKKQQNKFESDHRSEFSNFRNWKEEAWKKSGLQRDSNLWPLHYRCFALPTELWSDTLGTRSIYWVHISCEEWSDVKYIWNNSFLNCGCRWKWRLIITVNFPI